MTSRNSLPPKPTRTGGAPPIVPTKPSNNIPSIPAKPAKSLPTFSQEDINTKNDIPPPPPKPPRIPQNARSSLPPSAPDRRVDISSQVKNVPNRPSRIALQGIEQSLLKHQSTGGILHTTSQESKLPPNLKQAIESNSNSRPTKLKKGKKQMVSGGTLRLFGGKNKNSTEESIKKSNEEVPNTVVKSQQEPSISTAPTLLSVNNSFSKSRFARVEFRPENISKTINITTRTSPIEAFENMMNKMSKGLPPERRDTLVAKYASYTLYRFYEDGTLEQIYSDETLLSPLQLMDSNSTPTFLFTNQKVDAKTNRDVSTVNLGSMLQETHMKEEQKADNPVDEILLTERKFLFDTDLILEMVLKPLSAEDIISGNYFLIFKISKDFASLFFFFLTTKIPQI